MSESPRAEVNAVSQVLAPIKAAKKRGNPHMIAGPSDPAFPGMRPGDLNRNKSGNGRMKPGDPPRNPMGIGGPTSRDGQRPHALVFAESLMTDAAPEIAEKMIALAKEGNVAAGKLVLEYVIPKGKQRGVRFPLQIPTNDDPSEFEAAGKQLLEAVAAGLISTSESVEVAKVLTHYLDMIKTGLLAARIKAITDGEV